MDYTEEIFKMLNIKPYEEFKLPPLNTIYRFTDKLQIQNRVIDEWIDCVNPSLSDILSGELNIKKIETIEDEIVINYAKLCGCNYIAKDECGRVYAYKHKPIKHLGTWEANYFISIHHNVSCVSWDDTEPYHIS